MRRFACWIAVGLVLYSTGCGGPAEKRNDAPVDTTAAAAAPAPPEAPPEVNRLPHTDVEAVEYGSEYIVHGVCPFECCKYGNWTLQQGGALRSEPSRAADSVGSVAAAAAVQTDEGVMVLHPPGLAVVVPDTSSHNSSGPVIGDTVEVITYIGSKTSRVRWHDQEFEMSWGGLQVMREPLQRWWVHMTDPSTGQAGWLQMGGVNAMDVAAPNTCSKNK